MLELFRCPVLSADHDLAWSLLFVPLSLALKYVGGAAPVWVFLTGAVAVAILADWVRRATEQIADRAPLAGCSTSASAVSPNWFSPCSC